MRAKLSVFLSGVILAAVALAQQSVIGGAGVIEQSGTWTATLNGCTTQPTFAVDWVRVGNLVTMHLRTAGLTCTSNSDSLTTLSFGFPPQLIPVGPQGFAVAWGTINNGVTEYGPAAVRVAETTGFGNLQFFRNGLFSGWSSTGTKGFMHGITYSYHLR